MCSCATPGALSPLCAGQPSGVPLPCIGAVPVLLCGTLACLLGVGFAGALLQRVVVLVVCLLAVFTPALDGQRCSLSVPGWCSHCCVPHFLLL